jgi:hypothetical protein
MIVKAAVAGSNGFDCNTPLSAMEAEEFVKVGMIFCFRYFPLGPANLAGCLTGLELQVLLTAGLNVLAVQHVNSPGWAPTSELGSAHGSYAAAYGKAIGYPAGAPIYCDLEEVAPGTTAADVIAYCKAWYEAVTAAGYFAGLYCGWNIVLTAEQLYENLPFKSYWKAYNYDNGVAARGFQIVQHPQKTLDAVVYDPDTIQADELGDLPVWVTA